MFWIPDHYSKIVATTGYKVIARAGRIGSENSFEISTNDTNIPKHRTIDMYMKPAKCYWLKMLNHPNLGSVSKVRPLKKYVLKAMLKHIKKFTKSIDK